MKNGFTLIEILLVMVIIGVLVAMVAPNIAGRGEQAKEAAARTDIEANLSTALDLFRIDMGKYPTTAQGIDALFSSSKVSNASRWNGPYLKRKKTPVDPWGQEYQYRSPGTYNTRGYDLWSFGADGVESDDDVTNWE